MIAKCHGNQAEPAADKGSFRGSGREAADGRPSRCAPTRAPVDLRTDSEQ